MWLLHFFSDDFIAFIAHTVLLLGIVGCFLTFGLLNRLLRLFPMSIPYYQTLRAVSVLLLASGIYLQGGYSTEMAWRERVREMETRVAAAEKESQAANEKLTASGKEKIRVVREKGQVIKQYITREITQYDNTCAIPKEVVRAHNAAAKNEEIK